MNSMRIDLGFNGVRQFDAGRTKSTISGFSIDDKAKFIEIRDEDSIKNLSVYANEDGDLVILNKDVYESDKSADITIPRFLPRERVGELNCLFKALGSQNPETRAITLFDTTERENYPLKSDRALTIANSPGDPVTLCFNKDGSALSIK